MLVTLVILCLVSQQALTITYSCDPYVSCGCSTRPASLSRILGGEPALNNTWGWAVSILFQNTSYCGGTLISDSWVLTTVTCVRSHRSSDTFVSAATNTLIGRQQWRGASVVIPHPDYDYQTQVNDIALIKVSPPFDMTDSAIAQICMPTTMMTTEDYPPIDSSVRNCRSCRWSGCWWCYFSFVDVQMVAIGWGGVTPASTVSYILQQVTLRRVAYETDSCHSLITSRYLQFCASVDDGPKGKNLPMMRDRER